MKTWIVKLRSALLFPGHGLVMMMMMMMILRHWPRRCVTRARRLKGRLK